MPAEENVMDAVNAALGDAGTEKPEAETPETELPETPAESEGEETPSEDGETTEEAPSEDGETDAEAEARGAARGPDGKFVKKGEEPKAEGEKPKEPTKKEKDFVNDPIPENLKKDTQERMRGLITTVKEKTAELEKVSQDFNYMIKGVEATGTTPEQYGET